MVTGTSWFGGLGARKPRLACLLGVALTVAGCGGDDPTPATDTASDTSPDTQVADTLDTSSPDVAPDAADTAVDTAVPEVEEPVEVKDPVGFQEACSSNTECISGWCVPSATGNVCTRGCTEGCPDGWGCGRVLNVTIDQVEVCLDHTTTLCHPCGEDDDCNVFSGGATNRCLDLGSSGRFCGIPCSGSDVCPTGYGCFDEAGAPTTGEGWCRPSEGECTCNALAQDLELATSCATQNEVGTCTGARACGEAGLSACDAPAAAAETCNGLDDDCNGKTDEGLSSGVECDIVNTFGTCKGLFYCVEGDEKCLGTGAEQEICDGRDQDCDDEIDEGFPDFDGDEVADCMDPDDDNDGTADVEDCGILDADRSKSALESCGNGLDDDCDGSKDEEGATGCSTWYQDVDGDTHGSREAPGRCLCAAEPATYYVVKTADDCQDLDDAVKPGAPEVCNGLDDSCEGNTDEGVQAPCGGCANICLLKAGQQSPSAFNPTAATSSNVVVDGEGRLRLASGQTSGYHRIRWTGWPQGATSWDVLFVDAELPSGTSVSVRYRTAADEAGLAAASFSATQGPYPPAFFPLYLEMTGKVLEVEVALATSNASSPLVRKVSVLAGAD